MKVIIRSLVMAAVTSSGAPLACLAADGESQAAQTKAPVATALAQAELGLASTPSAHGDAAIEPEWFESGKRGARSAARHGPDALRRYVDRTRMIYALDIREFINPQP